MFVLGLTLPFEAVITPLYYEVRALGLLNTRWAIILPLIGLYMPFGVYWMRTHFVNTPKELSEAAQIDGAGEWKQFWLVHVPLARPVYLAYALVSISHHWNNFLWPLVMSNSVETRPLTVGLSVFASTDQGIDWGIINAATLISSAPLLLAFLLFQRQFVQSFLRAGIR